MKRITSLFLVMVALVWGINACIPDRMPPAPVENTRPEFASFDAQTHHVLNKPPDDPIRVYFNEKMDVATFPQNFTVSSVSGVVQGRFSYDEQVDTVIVFTPGENYAPAEVYDVMVSGRVRDIHGNSMIAPHEEDVPATTWFFSAGRYSENGFPVVFVRDKTNKERLYRIHDIIQYKDDLDIQSQDPDLQTAAIEFDPVNDYLYMVNLKVEGTVTVINPATLEIVQVIKVGAGPTNIAFSDQKAFVVNTSGKSFTVIDLASLAPEVTIAFDDGFKPKDAVYSQKSNKIYFIEKTKTDIKVVDAANYANTYTLTAILPDKKAIEMDISSDGRYIFLPEYKSGKVYVLDTDSDAITGEIDTGYGYNIDGVMGEQNYYLAFFKKSGNDRVGGIVKIDANSLAVTDELLWTRECDKIGLTNAEELVYAVAPADSSIQLVETSTLRNIAQEKINGSLKYVAVSKNNY